MGYNCTTEEAHTRVFVHTSMKVPKPRVEAYVQALSAVLSGNPVGLISAENSDNITGDLGDYLPSLLARKNVLNEYIYRTLNAQGPTLIVLHGTGNEDAHNALLAGSQYGQSYGNLSFVSLGSPVSNKAMRQVTSRAGAQFLGMVNDWRDPMTYSKTAGTLVAGSFVSGLVFELSFGCAAEPVLFSLDCLIETYTGALIGVAVSGVLGGLALLGITRYPPMPRYLQKQATRSLLSQYSNDPSGIRS